MVNGFLLLFYFCVEVFFVQPFLVKTVFYARWDHRFLPVLCSWDSFLSFWSLWKKKSPLHTVHVQRANVSRYHLFLCFFLAYLRDLLTGIGRAGLLSKFSLSVQKLPSIPAFLQIPLSLSGISLWRCPGMYSSFSQPLFFFAIVCIIAEDFSFVKGEFRSLLLRNFLRLFH